MSLGTQGAQRAPSQAGQDHAVAAAVAVASAAGAGARSRPHRRASLGGRAALLGLLPTILILSSAGVAFARDLVLEANPVAVRAPGLRPGDIVSDHGISVEVPPAGQSVWGELKFRDGTYQILTVSTDRQGRVALLELGDESAAGSTDVVVDGGTGATGKRASVTLAADTPTGVGETGFGTESAATSSDGTATGTQKADARGQCADRYHNLYWWRLKNLRWHYQVAGTPAYLLGKDGSVDDIVAVLERADENVTSERNACGRGDRVGMKGRYVGVSKRHTNVGSRGTCSKGDGVSVIGFGDLPSYSVAMTCVYLIRNNVAREADIRINSADPLWSLSRKTCKGDRLLLEAAMTHEFGHAYGLAHASSWLHPTLTMQPIIPFCSLAPATLGLGDMRGLERKY